VLDRASCGQVLIFSRSTSLRWRRGRPPDQRWLGLGRRRRERWKGNSASGTISCLGGQPCGGGGHTRTYGWAPSLDIGRPQLSLTNPRHFIAKVDPVPLSSSLYLLFDDIGERNQARVSTTTTTRSLIWTVTNESNNKLRFVLCALLEEKTEIEEMKQLTATVLWCGTVVVPSAGADSKVDVCRILGSWPCLMKLPRMRRARGR
jgi:hypothetical protein